ncbi:MAG TPA: hypothetical protein VLA43_11810 [Longimicrobiales bacterium]|nr:hypothetical protein [Longimicrobiales bacterium]
MRRGRPLTAAALLMAGAAAPAAAQTRELAQRCTGDPVAAIEIRCQEAALAVEALQAGVGLALVGGNPLPGGASSLGRRFGRTPRVALNARVGLTRFPLPDLAGATVGDQRVLVPSIHATATVGVLNGFSPAPTVGGLLSLDLLATVGAAFLPDDRGLPGTATGWGYGARVGLLRESFTLPGVTVSVTRNHSGTVDFVPVGPDGEPRAAVDVTTTSVRGVVGKEFMAVGLLAGAGWDRYSSDGSVTPRATLADPIPDPRPVENVTSDRALFFAGISRTFLVLQLSGEVGWARGFGEVDPALPGYDPGAGTLFGTVSLRLTF